MSTTQGAWECVHGVDGRDWCDDCYSTDPAYRQLNYYGLPITSPELFDGEHVAMVPAAGGLPPVCSCGWTRHEVDGHWFEMADHLADMQGDS